MKKLLVSGSGGLIGSEAVSYFCEKGWKVWGFDNNQRGKVFGPEGSTKEVSAGLKAKYLHQFEEYYLDVRDRHGVQNLVADFRPNLILHTAAQPSHDMAGKNPLEAWDINATGTVNLLEGMRQFAPEAAFVFLSSSKVYGDRLNACEYTELETRYQPTWLHIREGINEGFPIDFSMHSLLGSTKAAADLAVQEYGRYYGLATACLRCGCLTGSNHQAVEDHGFLAYLVKCAVQRKPYKIYGYKGKQVRDNIHAVDVVRFAECYYDNPTAGAVYNIGGGEANSCSILEAFKMLGYDPVYSGPVPVEYIDQPRKGDHRWYVSDCAKARKHYPSWGTIRPLRAILAELGMANEESLSRGL